MKIYVKLKKRNKKILKVKYIKKRKKNLKKIKME